MSSLPRRANQTAHSRTSSRANLAALGDAPRDLPTVVSSTALPRTVPHSMPDRSQESLPPLLPKHPKPAPPSTPREHPASDPFQAISRAIHNAKIRTGARLSALAVKQRYARSTARHRSIYAKAAAATRIVFCVMLLVFVMSLLLDAYSSRSDFGVAAVRNIFFGRDPGAGNAKGTSVREMLRHRPAAVTARHFDTGPWVIGVITDLDKDSCRVQESRDTPMRVSPCGKANSWVSYFKRGVLKLESPARSAKFRKIPGQANTVEWLDELELNSHGHYETERESHRRAGGRGMELSELEWFFGHLVTPDDHTGMLLEIMSPRGQLDRSAHQQFYGESSKVAPSTFHRATLLDGSGTDKSTIFKSEWMVIKDDKLIIGGHGRSYTDPSDGTRIKNNNPKWVKVVRKDFTVSHENWSSRYDALAKGAGVPFPGYLMHEAVLWSNERKEWVFLPRRKSNDPFDAAKNERQGSNIAILASDDFQRISVVEIEGLFDSTGLRGFSSAKFVPGTEDKLVAAVRTVEIESSAHPGKGRETASFLSVFDVTSGEVIFTEQQFSSKKFEGLVFL